MSFRNETETLVQHSLEQLQDGQHDVVDVAEPRGLGLLGVVKPPGPVHRDVRLLPVELHGTRWETTGGKKNNKKTKLRDGLVDNLRSLKENQTQANSRLTCGAAG